MQTVEFYIQSRYSNFVWLAEWTKHAESLRTIDEKAIFFRGITKYGLDGLEPEFSPELMQYFNSHIRPELDRQHAKINRKKQ